MKRFMSLLKKSMFALLVSSVLITSSAQSCPSDVPIAMQFSPVVYIAGTIAAVKIVGWYKHFFTVQK